MGMRLRSGCVRADPRRRGALPECVRVCELGDVCLCRVRVSVCCRDTSKAKRGTERKGQRMCAFM